MKKTKLHLRRETVRTLAARGLRNVVGGLAVSGNVTCDGYSDADDCSVGCGGGGGGTYGCATVQQSNCQQCGTSVSSMVKLGNNYGC